MILIPYGQAWTIRGWQLVDRATGQYKVTPTLAAGDVKIEKDGGAAANLATLPSVEPAAGTSIKIPISATEAQCKQIVIRFSDAAGAEWNDDCIYLFTVGHPSAYMQFDLFSASVALSSGSVSQVSGAVWNELRENHILPGTFGEKVLSALDIDSILDELIGNGTLTMRQALKVIVASTTGKSSGAQPGAATISFRDAADTANIIVATTDENGNRLSVTLNL